MIRPPLLVSSLLMLGGLAVAATASADPLAIRDAWVRQPPPRAHAAAYMSLSNPGPEDVRIVGVDSDAAARAEIHRSGIVDGVARMTPVEHIEIAAGETVVLAPRGLHVMLIDPSVLKPEQVVEIRLLLEGGASVTARATVRAGGYGGGHHQGHHEGHPGKHP